MGSLLFLAFTFKDQMSIIKGDSLSYSVAAASIIAKVTRDKLMNFYGKIYPRYNFTQNKGYATPDHIEAIKKFGRCEIHRKSFRLQFEKDPQMHLDHDLFYHNHIHLRSSLYHVYREFSFGTGKNKK